MVCHTPHSVNIRILEWSLQEFVRKLIDCLQDMDPEIEYLCDFTFHQYPVAGVVCKNDSRQALPGGILSHTKSLLMLFYYNGLNILKHTTHLPVNHFVAVLQLSNFVVTYIYTARLTKTIHTGCMPLYICKTSSWHWPWASGKASYLHETKYRWTKQSTDLPFTPQALL